MVTFSTAGTGTGNPARVVLVVTAVPGPLSPGKTAAKPTAAAADMRRMKFR